MRLAQKARATGHPHGARHPAAVGQRGHGPDQGELPVAGSRSRWPARSTAARSSTRPAPRTSSAAATCSTSRPTCRGRCASRACSSSDPEIGRVTEHWRDQIDGPALRPLDHHLRRGVHGHRRATLADDDADRLLPDAVSVIREYDRASASLLQRRLKIGYARAARIIDQLEARGYVGAFDGSNARVVLRRDDGPAADGTRTTHDDARRGAARRALQARDADRAYATGGRPVAPGAAARRPRAQGRRPATAPSATRRSGRATSRRSSAATTRELPGAVYTKGFLRNYALYLGLDPEDVIRQWKRERGDAAVPGRAGARGPQAARRAAPGPDASRRSSSSRRC